MRAEETLIAIDRLGDVNRTFVQTVILRDLEPMHVSLLAAMRADGGSMSASAGTLEQLRYLRNADSYGRTAAWGQQRACSSQNSAMK